MHSASNHRFNFETFVSQQTYFDLRPIQFGPETALRQLMNVKTKNKSKCLPDKFELEKTYKKASIHAFQKENEINTIFNLFSLYSSLSGPTNNSTLYAAIAKNQ